MAKTKKQLLSSAPWRDEENPAEKFKDAKMKVTNQPGTTPTMHVPGKKRSSSNNNNNEDDDSLSEIDQQLVYSFKRNFEILMASRMLRNHLGLDKKRRLDVFVSQNLDACEYHVFFA
ncbi:uncharacterized protein LOC104902568 isoform X3 [Beta vulgaris subsp. vulgaris]|uniref:uncharacterized protein LOC104902568 isoform X3 n=1 Tax=Beta vulgaris subsp. vulgaris TaxID=3555 RepID=UPI0020373ADC|nr:uncharacterized protein LOC104902568 isoform X3 [Beta vulgaris subsp. vulgaris]